MKLGQACYCDGCGAEVVSGASVCSECDPAHGAEQITYTFIVTLPEEDVEPEPEAQPRKKLFGLF